MERSFFEQEVENALKHLKAGNVILYPTDTIWGLGCDATNEAAIENIYRIKQREDSKSLIILLADERDILTYVAGPDPEVFVYLEQADRPTTVIFENALNLPSKLIAKDGSVAIRLVQDEFCRHLVKRMRKPLVSTSANISGTTSPFTFMDVSEQIKSQVQHIVGWRQDDNRPAQPSRIIRWKDGKPFVIRE